MSIWDNVKKFAQPYSDDEYDDYDDYDDEYDDEVEEEPVRRAPRKAPRATRAPRRNPVQRDPEPEIEEDDYEEDFTAAFNTVTKPSTAVAPAAPAVPAERSFPGKVVSMNRNAQEIVRFHPTSFQDSRKAASDLVASKAVIVNLEELDSASSRRMVDFLSGVVFAMDGDVQKIAQNAYVFCPPNMVISGGPEALQSIVEDLG
jgi:cell division inhibitor SepF